MSDIAQPDSPAAVQPAPATFEAAGEQLDVREVHAAIMRERSEPLEGREPTPLWLITVMGLIVFFAGFYLANYSGGFKPLVFDERAGGQLATAQPPKPVDMMVLGKRTFLNNCQQCHQETGVGLPGQYPPLAGSEWVQAGDPSRIIRIVLDGFHGPVTVKGQTFNNVMVPWRTVLNDQQIAAVLTYVRQAWGNQAAPVTEDQVKAIRAQTQNRTGTPWTAAELEQIPANPPATATKVESVK